MSGCMVAAMMVGSLWGMQEGDYYDVDGSHRTLVFDWGVAGRQGRRPAMEDRHLALTTLVEGGFFSVYDGHGGARAANYAVRAVPMQLMATFDRNNAAANHAIFKELFNKIDSDLLMQTTSGTTVALSYIRKDSGGDYNAYFVWVGDTRMMHCDVLGENLKFVSVDHKPNNALEKQRILAHGGYIVTNCYASRVNGQLAMSRALGDAVLKKECPGAVVADPEIHICSVVDGDIIIIASDGFWDVVTNEQAQELVKQVLKNNCIENHNSALPSESEFVVMGGNNNDLRNCSQLLRDYAYQQGSGDNITVMVVRVALK